MVRVWPGRPLRGTRSRTIARKRRVSRGDRGGLSSLRVCHRRSEGIRAEERSDAPEIRGPVVALGAGSSHLAATRYPIYNYISDSSLHDLAESRATRGIDEPFAQDLVARGS